MLDVVGRGAMGTVYAAYDPELDRKVAIKVVSRGRDTARDHTRLFREAQALGRIGHPNVIAVHDVGIVEHGVYIAMELIQGGRSLGEYCEGESWQAVARACLAAGEGLAAAHRTGLVHRDFKPANVLVDPQGRVRVLDFGLAGPETALPEIVPDAVTKLADGRTPLGADLTEAGVRVGTPAYMAPEQHEASTRDARSDQFSFCVSTWELLYGQRPYAGSGTEEIWSNAREGQILAPPKSPVPDRLRAALERGLDPDPGRRHADMDALLQEIRDVLEFQPRSRAVVTVFASVAVAAGVGALAWTMQSERCTGAEAKLSEIWDDARRGAVESAVLGIDVPYAAATWERSRRDLDAFAGGWVDMHTEACRATTVHGEQSAAVLDLRMACLDRARTELRATVDALERLDAESVQHAESLVTALPSLERCADIEALQSTVPPPEPEDEPAVDAARASLAAARAGYLAGRFEDATAQLEDARREAANADYAPLDTELVLAEGELHKRAGRDREAEGALKRALVLAGQHRQWEIAFAAAAQLVYIVGSRLGLPEEGLRYVEFAEAVGDGELLSEARLRFSIGAVVAAQGKYDEATKVLQQARDAFLAAPGDHRVKVLGVDNLMSTVLIEQGKHEEAIEVLKQNLAGWEELRGPEHPEYALALHNLGAAYTAHHDFDEGEKITRRAVEAWDALGLDHAFAAAARSNYAACRMSKGHLVEAEAEYRRALATKQRILRPGHPSIAEAPSRCNASPPRPNASNARPSGSWRRHGARSTHRSCSPSRISARWWPIRGATMTRRRCIVAPCGSPTRPSTPIIPAARSPATTSRAACIAAATARKPCATCRRPWISSNVAAAATRTWSRRREPRSRSGRASWR